MFNLLKRNAPAWPQEEPRSGDFRPEWDENQDKIVDDAVRELKLNLERALKVEQKDNETENNA